MPSRTFVVDVNTGVGPLQVTSRIVVEGPFFGGSSGVPEDAIGTATARSLAERLERAVLAVIQDARSEPATCTYPGTPSTRETS